MRMRTGQCTANADAVRTAAADAVQTAGTNFLSAPSLFQTLNGLRFLGGLRGVQEPECRSRLRLES